MDMSAADVKVKKRKRKRRLEIARSMVDILGEELLRAIWDLTQR